MSYTRTHHVGIIPETSCFGVGCSNTRPQGYKTFFMLNSAELEITIPHKYRNSPKSIETEGLELQSL